MNWHFASLVAAIIVLLKGEIGTHALAVFFVRSVVYLKQSVFNLNDV